MFFLFLHIYPKRGVTQYNTHLKHLSSMASLGDDLTNSHEWFWMKNKHKKPQNYDKMVIRGICFLKPSLQLLCMTPIVSYQNMRGGPIIHQMKAYGVYFSNISNSCLNNFVSEFY